MKCGQGRLHTGRVNNWRDATFLPCAFVATLIPTHIISASDGNRSTAQILLAMEYFARSRHEKSWSSKKPLFGSTKRLFQWSKI
jgi:hypothetical protein